MAILLTASMSALEVKRASSELKVNVSFDPKRIQYHAVVLTNQLVPRVIKYRIDERRALRETVVTLCDGETVHLSQNKHPDLFGYCREENQKCVANTSCFFLRFPLWDSKGAVCERMKFFRNSASSVVLFANCASHRCGLHVSSLTSQVTTSAPLNAQDVQTLR